MGSLDLEEAEPEVKEVDELLQKHLFQARDGELYVKYKGQLTSWDMDEVQIPRWASHNEA